MRFRELVDYSDKLKKVSSRNAKIELVIDFLKKLDKKEAEIGVSFISCKVRQGRLNIAWAGLSELPRTPSGGSNTSPTLIEIDEFLERTKSARGSDKMQVLSALFARLSKQERKYLVALILIDVRQGVAEGIVKIAISEIFGLDDSEIEYANMHEPDLGRLFVLLRGKGKDALKNLGVRLFYPVKPMLAEIAESIEDLYEMESDFALEHKLDGIRIQIHRKGEEVRIFSRHLKDITDHFPDLVEIAKTIPVKEFILDGEAIGIGKNGKSLPFQVLARRTTRRKDIEVLKKTIPVIPKFFDVIYLSGEETTAGSYTERWKTLADVVRNKKYLVTRGIPSTKSEAKKFLQDSLASGNEGLVAKLFDSPYQAGKRGNLWFKLKSSQTIDCVILAAEWGHGRRTGWLSNLHLGVLDETKTKYLMVGKTFKGLTDQMLAWLTENLEKITVHRDKWVSYVKPEVVIEVAYNGAQQSPKYDSGFALRFARVKRIRTDKSPKEINTVLDLKGSGLDIRT